MKLVSFDVWNTLLDINVMLDAMAIELSKLMGTCLVDVVEGMILTRGRIKRMRAETAGDPARALEESQELLAELFEIDVELVKRAAARAVLKVGDDIVLPGAREALEGVKRKGLKVTVTGNVMFWPGSYTRLLLERFGLMDYIDKTFFADEVLAYKPMKEMFEKPLRVFNVSPDEAIHIGDTYTEDFEGALKAGLWAVWINPEAEEIRKIHERGFEVPNVEGILEVLGMIEAGSI
ncbi:HAD family hydrolase [Thermococcus thioreducens]|uniref:2-haloalkanoic acid dehalogenase n=1 Tax=Thermococcus thioreducens TaxID=277988 RepID=A0A0Q2S3D3_9EURY|nr:HAD family hydrolase [Thermococcus thioreducens]ASJ11739.1 2-haloalkanoic acid dehalogenase [Thermococcus thioreducens]KQH81971.1 2-haloalkanoic acid dehalogenase [Thermococcus thioreducens]SEW14714.1 putative hydrolase of the HAD superfamily [Thermococcus thioreducens]